MLAASAVPALWADSTLRTQNTMRFGGILPGPIAQRTRNGLASTLPDSTVRYRKGNREYLNSGGFTCVMDYGKQTITIIDAANKHFATVPMKDYVSKLAAAMPVLPPEFQPVDEVSKSSLESRKTGRTSVIKGVAAEETEMRLTLELPAPTPEGKMQLRPLIKMTMQVWTAKTGNATPVPALRDWLANSWPDDRYSLAIDPANILATTLGAMPGVASSLGKMFQEVEKSHAVVLKMHLEAGMLGVSGALQDMKKEKGEAAAQGLDPEAPFVVVDSEVQEISASPADQMLFQVPAGYTAAPFDVVVKAVAPNYPKS